MSRNSGTCFISWWDVLQHSIGERREIFVPGISSWTSKERYPYWIVSASQTRWATTIRPVGSRLSPFWVLALIDTAPEELSDWENDLEYSRTDPIVAESFSIGLTIVDAALLFDSELLYVLEPVMGFKNHVFKTNLVRWKSRPLSPFLIRTVVNMLEVRVLERPSPGEVHAILSPY